ncbi:uncharacterized protein EV420DRAFT_1476145 [Desarmillaria tabescens]|uniref:Uncharacterized protein n=1 Tax=Armillaria tabescens TaxID=1929756 RepID=A0AA39NFY6_ARMTA|nr:uncharacterized protein EV420DRAFT_1476145 [Desarmillaria tabescens]KAK0464753.1 hypothetical protein EV420DRAFT_1476145 [Desarmillaria tabescens]
MLSTIEYCASVTPEPYEPAPTPKGIWPEDLEAFYDEQDVAEKAREDAVEAHEAWKAQKQKEEKRWALELEQRGKLWRPKQGRRGRSRRPMEKKWQEETEAKAKAEAATMEQQRLEEEARALEERKAAEKKKLEGEAKAKALVEARKAMEAEKEKEKRLRTFRGSCKIKSSAVVVSGEEEVMGPSGRPLKKLKTEPEMQVDDEEYKGNEHCGRCKADDVKCFIRCRRTCEQSRVKGQDPLGSYEVVYLLQQLCDKMDNFQEGLERVEGKVDFLGSWVDNLVDDFHEGDTLEWPSGFVDEEFREEWAVSKAELGNLKNMWNAHMMGTKSLNTVDPFKVTNMQVWYGCLGKDGLQLAIKQSRSISWTQGTSSMHSEAVRLSGRCGRDFAILHPFMQSTSSTESYSGGFVLVAKYYIKNEGTAVQNRLRNNVSKSQFYQPSTRQAKPLPKQDYYSQISGTRLYEYKNQEVEEWNELDAFRSRSVDYILEILRSTTVFHTYGMRQALQTEEGAPMD